jgi:hypothetical protein
MHRTLIWYWWRSSRDQNIGFIWSMKRLRPRFWCSKRSQHVSQLDIERVINNMTHQTWLHTACCFQWCIRLDLQCSEAASCEKYTKDYGWFLGNIICSNVFRNPGTNPIIQHFLRHLSQPQQLTKQTRSMKLLARHRSLRSINSLVNQV